MKTQIRFPEFSGIRVLMMPYIQGEVDSLPVDVKPYFPVLESLFFKKGDIGFLTIDESQAIQGSPHRNSRAKFSRPLHTEAGLRPNKSCGWGTWGAGNDMILNRDVKVMLASNIENTTAVWNVEHPNTSIDGDIGDCADLYPYEQATLLDAGEVAIIGIFTPHESLPVKETCNRQFIRIISSGVQGRELYFTKNPVMNNLN